MAVLLTFPLFRAFDPNGLPLNGGKVYTFAAGTSVPLGTYTDATGLTLNANPTILDANGEASIWLGATTAYKIDLFNAVDVHQPGFPVDALQASLFGGSGTLIAVATLAAVTGPTLIATNLIPAGARVLTVGTKILTGFGTSGGLTQFAVGDSAIINRWGLSSALTTNALTGTSDAPASAQPSDATMAVYPTATHVVISALDGAFDNVGSLQVSVQYLLTPYRAA